MQKRLPLSRMVEIDNHIANIFVFYLIITSNFFVPLLPCRAQSIISDSIFLRHLFGLLTMTFFVVLASTKTPLPFSKIVGLSLGLYVWFMISTRIRFDMWLLLVTLFGTMYVVKIYKDNSDTELTEPQKEKIELTEKILFFIAIGVTALGGLLYLGEKKIEYGGQFNYHRFLFGQVSCKGYSPPVSAARALKALF